MKIAVDVDDGVKGFLERYAAARDVTLEEVLRGLILSDVKRLVEGLSTEERAEMLGLGGLFR
ncbi:MAG: hypothetical protein JRN11_07205 [Nitrososphaerota archaeon]|nr:hypothetical protein [Nitrososphaerota archaeon]MDG7013252.1 hypothetical protein [Nitrososphaerota archaeon]MDG7026517.1 hypothetical protein [Nitrososphaerota archaeon]